MAVALASKRAGLAMTLKTTGLVLGLGLSLFPVIHLLILRERTNILYNF